MFKLLKHFRINNRLNIKHRMMLIVLSISIATLIILSAVSFYGIIGSKNMAIENYAPLRDYVKNCYESRCKS